MTLAPALLLFMQADGGSAQVQQVWAARYEEAGRYALLPTSMAVDAADNVYVAGSSPLNFVVLKYSADGNELWRRHYGGEGAVAGLVIDAAGNVVVTGYVWNGKDTDFLTVKYDPLGNQMWLAPYNGATIPFGSHDEPAGIAVDRDGHVYVTGTSEKQPLSIEQYVTIKYDAQGNELWIQTYGASGVAEAAAALALDAQGNVYVTGSSAGGRFNYPDYATLKYSPDGLLLWEVRYDANGDFDDARAVTVDQAGNVYVTGTSYIRGPGGWSGDYTTIKYDSSGNQVWLARYGDVFPGTHHPQKIKVDPAGNVVVTGYSSGASGSVDFATVKYDPDGHQMWVARYDGPAQYGDYVGDLTVDSLGNVYVTGQISVDCFFDPQERDFVCATDFATIKYAPDGRELWVMRYDGPGHWYDSGSAIVLDSKGSVLVSGPSAGLGRSAGIATVKYAVPTPCDAISDLIAYIEKSSLTREVQRPLVVSLRNACRHFEAGDNSTGANLVRAFQHKVRAQVTRRDPDLANELIRRAQEILDAPR